MTAASVHKQLLKLADKNKALQLQGYFKTAPGDYGYGDVFLGIRMPVLRELAKQYQHTAKEDLLKLLSSKYHEERMLALLLLVLQFKNSSAAEQKEIYQLYLKNTCYINNWDLVDCTAEHVVGAYLFEKSRAPLFRLASSKSLWERRIAVVATFYFIKKEDFADALKLYKKLLADEEDLMHKALGWMLREIGKRNLKTEEQFLKQHYASLPRTTLRYAIERFPEKKRQRYLKGRF